MAVFRVVQTRLPRIYAVKLVLRHQLRRMCLRIQILTATTSHSNAFLMGDIGVMIFLFPANCKVLSMGDVDMHSNSDVE